jgi:hypothetical protein
MSRIRALIREDSKQIVYGTNSVENSLLRTTEKILISENSTALLPSLALGNIVWNMALLFDNAESSMISKEVTVTTNGTHVLFDSLDDVKGMYCIVSYLTYKE